MAVKNIKSLAHFIAACSEIQVKDDHTLFYRGHASDAFTPLPTIFRNQNDDSKKSRYVENEGELFHNLVTQCPEEFKDCTSTFDFLVKMQHYGLPTRLLDITSNPLVALYFSCCSLIPDSSRDKNAKNGQVLIYQVPNDEIKYYNSDTVSVVSNLARAEANFDFSDIEHQERFLHSIQAEKPYFKPYIKEEHLHSVICVKPKLDNRRIVKQSGAFFLFGMGKQKTDSIRIPDHFRPEIKHIAIPKASKEALLKELATLSISEATLFPEIDNVARFLKKDIKIKQQPQEEASINFDEIIPQEYQSLIVTHLLANDGLLEQIKNNSEDRAKKGDYPDLLEKAIIESQVEHNEIALKLLVEDEIADQFSVNIFNELKQRALVVAEEE
ncbi:FRG domain-containing protein [Vibrio natriegens]|uniref:FRG domain-containing protein n=1 Tax=Vibrio TaxID=662 RepID=UPI0021E7DE7C|nr:FRG domain-containing protein [Vibrio natriegens]UYI50192.1 FRG domain-containing protein [Vibrio natriegens]HAV1571121.1 FRG domain-containing protein [Vibrio parahaemolyticus]HAV1979465.1 FRG domain-containing protein [Vibrio parahaemolyticus]